MRLGEAALADQLTDMGVSVVGPCGSVAEARCAAIENDLDAAILDVNLGGELVYPVADLLSARGVPFIFVTGYGHESIDKKFSYAPVLEKPVEHALLAEMLSRSLESVPLQARVGPARR